MIPKLAETGIGVRRQNGSLDWLATRVTLEGDRSNLQLIGRMCPALRLRDLEDRRRWHDTRAGVVGAGRSKSVPSSICLGRKRQGRIVSSHPVLPTTGTWASFRPGNGISAAVFTPNKSARVNGQGSPFKPMAFSPTLLELVRAGLCEGPHGHQVRLGPTA